MCIKINRSVKTPWHSPSIWELLAPGYGLLKTVNISRYHCWFSSEMTSEERTLKFHADDTSLPWSSDWLKQIFNQFTEKTVVASRHVVSRQTCLLGGWVNKPFPCPLEPLYQNEVIISAQPLIWKGFFIPMQIKLFFTIKVVHLASSEGFWNSEAA